LNETDNFQRQCIPSNVHKSKCTRWFFLLFWKNDNRMKVRNLHPWQKTPKPHPLSTLEKRLRERLSISQWIHLRNILIKQPSFIPTSVVQSLFQYSKAREPRVSWAVRLDDITKHRRNILLEQMHLKVSRKLLLPMFFQDFGEIQLTLSEAKLISKLLPNMNWNWVQSKLVMDLKNNSCKWFISMWVIFVFSWILSVLLTAFYHLIKNSNRSKVDEHKCLSGE